MTVPPVIASTPIDVLFVLDLTVSEEDSSITGPFQATGQPVDDGLICPT
jgi:hypothetical protein